MQSKQLNEIQQLKLHNKFTKVRKFESLII